MNYDQILEELGEFGKWQQIVAFLLWIPLGIGGIHVLMYSFTGNYSFAHPGAQELMNPSKLSVF